MKRVVGILFNVGYDSLCHVSSMPVNQHVFALHVGILQYPQDLWHIHKPQVVIFAKANVCLANIPWPIAPVWHIPFRDQSRFV